MLAASSSAQALPPTPSPSVATTGWSVSPTTVVATRNRSLALASRLINVSDRAVAGNAPAALVAGTVLPGSGTAPMLRRALGPGRWPFGVTNALRDPARERCRYSASATTTSAVTGNATVASAYVGAFPLVPTAGASAGDATLRGHAAVRTLTAPCSPPPNTSGVALLEFYDATARPPPRPRMASLFARGSALRPAKTSPSSALSLRARAHSRWSCAASGPRWRSSTCRAS